MSCLLRADFGWLKLDGSVTVHGSGLSAVCLVRCVGPPGYLFVQSLQNRLFRFGLLLSCFCKVFINRDLFTYVPAKYSIQMSYCLYRDEQRPGFFAGPLLSDLVLF